MKPTSLTTIAGLLLFICSIQAQTGLSARLMTVFGEFSPSGSPWTVRVSDTGRTFQISYHYDSGTNSSGSITVASPSDWRAKLGWFVFIENSERIWAYDGDQNLFLQVSIASKQGLKGTSYGSRTFPCPVPDEVLTRLSPKARKAIKSAKK